MNNRKILESIIEDKAVNCSHVISCSDCSKELGICSQDGNEEIVKNAEKLLKEECEMKSIKITQESLESAFELLDECGEDIICDEGQVYIKKILNTLCGQEVKEERTWKLGDKIKLLGSIYQINFVRYVDEKETNKEVILNNDRGCCYLESFLVKDEHKITSDEIKQVVKTEWVSVE